MNKRIYLNVPKAHQGHVLHYGALYDNQAKRYYTTEPVCPALENYIEQPARTRDYSQEMSPQCPKCGSIMLLRNGVQGRPDFWGCASFPYCRSTKPADT